MTHVTIAGGGPAGSAAALSALAHGATVEIYEKSTFPRHKVCGEFLSPEVEPILRQLGAWDAFERAQPSRIQQVRLHFGSREKRWTLAEPAFGLSRYTLDDLLLKRAAADGARVRQETAVSCRIAAHGRKSAVLKGRRLFGFKAHFEGPVDDAVDLFFFAGCYAGVSAVEQGRTNVCGLAPEDVLRRHGFDIDSFINSALELRWRVTPLRRVMKWLVTGPLVFSNTLPVDEGRYPAGDALGFIDPFTGSGVSTALESGRLAGESAAREIPVHQYLRRCHTSLAWQYRTSGIVRRALESGLGEWLAPFIPGKLLFQLTRPKRIA